MSKIISNRKKIIAVGCLYAGAGLGFSLKNTVIKSIKVGADFNIANERSTSFLTVNVTPTIVFDAGYEISADYIFTSSDNNIDVSTTEKVLDYIKNGAFNLDIDFTDSEYMPYDNWSITVYEQSLLDEIKEVLSCENTSKNEYEINEAFGLTCDFECEEVAYSLLSMLTPHQKDSADVSAINTAFEADMRKITADAYQKLQS